MNNPARNAYLSQMVATASPAKLLVMLFDRLVLDLERAAELQEAGEHLAASPHLLHAQEIVLELRTSLRLDVWEGAEQLAEIYVWLHKELVRANVSRDVTATRECLAIVAPLAESWREAALASLAG
jgi:flagellar protein FliS